MSLAQFNLISIISVNFSWSFAEEIIRDIFDDVLRKRGQSNWILNRLLLATIRDRLIRLITKIRLIFTVTLSMQREERLNDLCSVPK